MSKASLKRERNRKYLESLPVAERCPQCGCEDRFWADLGLTKSPLKVAYAECPDCGTKYRVENRKKT